MIESLANGRYPASMSVNTPSLFPDDAADPGLTVVFGWPDHTLLLTLIARLALRGPLRLIVGGNRFDAHHLARQLRRQTVRLDEALERIHLARPFTGYQLIALLEESDGRSPLVCLDLLDTFYDDAISPAESVRLAHLAVGHLRRCQATAPTLVTLRPAPSAAGRDLSPIVRAAADRVTLVAPPPAPEQRPLFPQPGAPPEPSGRA